MAALGVALLPGSAMSQTLKQQLVGTWMLAAWEQDVPNGPKFQRFGANPKGYHIFEANGRFYTMFARPDLPKIASNNPSNPTPDEAKSIVSGAIAYYGTYTIDEASKVVTLNIESSSFPNQVGAVQKRTITSISATELKMQNTTALTGGQIYYTLKKAN
jgi:hypothetical protein